MSSDATFVFVLIGVAGALMASNRVRYDLVALIVVIALIVSGTLTSGEALSGFGSPVVIMVVGLLIVGEMLDRTGIAHSIGNLILRYGGQNERRLTVLLMLGAAFLGCIMSSTAIVAIFVPIILRISANTGLRQSRLLLPMSYAALISGMLTLIATPPNLVVSDSLQENGYEPLGFFGFFPIGFAILIVAVVYTLTFAQRALAQGDTDQPQEPGNGLGGQTTAIELLESYALLEQFHLVEVVAKPRTDIHGIFGSIDARVLARSRPDKRGKQSDAFVSSMEFLPGDRLLVTGTQIEVDKLCELTEFKDRGVLTGHNGEWDTSVGIADVLVHPEAKIVGRTVKEYEFRDQHGVDVIGVMRNELRLDKPYLTPLKAGDRLMIAGPQEDIDAFSDRNHDFVLLRVPKERGDMPLVLNKALVSLVILLSMVFLSISGLVPVVVAVMIAAIAAVLFRTLSPERAYGSIHWSSIVLVAGMLPLADALQKTGGADVVVTALLDIVGDGSPRTMMVMLFGVTAGLGLVLSNTATAVLVAPIAITAAEALQVSPYPFAICVLMAASAAFSTPVSTPVVTLVVAPGGYKFAHFLKIGLPLTILVGLVTILITPYFFPL